MGRKITCSYCGIVTAPHKCSKKSRDKTNRVDNKIYRTQEWREVREEVLDESKGLCVWSWYVVGKIVKATHCHHIHVVLEDSSRVYDKANLIGLERQVHKYIHELYKTNKEEVQGLLLKCKDRMSDKGLMIEDLGIYDLDSQRILDLNVI